MDTSLQVDGNNVRWMASSITDRFRGHPVDIEVSHWKDGAYDGPHRLTLGPGDFTVVADTDLVLPGFGNHRLALGPGDHVFFNVHDVTVERVRAHRVIVTPR